MYCLTRFILLLALALLGGARSPAQSHTNVQTVFLILKENVSWPDLVNRTNAPLCLEHGLSSPCLVRSGGVSARQGAGTGRPSRTGGGTEFVRALGPGVRR